MILQTIFQSWMKKFACLSKTINLRKFINNHIPSFNIYPNYYEMITNGYVHHKFHEQERTRIYQIHHRRWNSLWKITISWNFEKSMMLEQSSSETKITIFISSVQLYDDYTIKRTSWSESLLGNGGPWPSCGSWYKNYNKNKSSYYTFTQNTWSTIIVFNFYNSNYQLR